MCDSLSLPHKPLSLGALLLRPLLPPTDRCRQVFVCVLRPRALSDQPSVIGSVSFGAESVCFNENVLFAVAALPLSLYTPHHPTPHTPTLTSVVCAFRWSIRRRHKWTDWFKTGEGWPGLSAPRNSIHHQGTIAFSSASQVRITPSTPRRPDGVVRLTTNEAKRALSSADLWCASYLDQKWKKKKYYDKQTEFSMREREFICAKSDFVWFFLVCTKFTKWLMKVPLNTWLRQLSLFALICSTI